MDKLPTEILQEIIGWAPFTRDELIANRLVCCRFCSIFTPHAFRTVRTNNFTRESFDRLCSIADTSHLAELVVEYEYRLVEFLELPNHHDVDDLLSLGGLHSYQGDGPESTFSASMGSNTMQLEALTRRIYEQHQLYLLQQDILGTFYDTASIFSSLPLFKKLQTIRIIDFEIPPNETPNPEETPYTVGHDTAVVRAIHNISKTLAFLQPSALPNLRCWEIERFDYSVLKPPSRGWNSRDPEGDEILIQIEDALSRISNFRINKLRSLDIGQQHCPFVFAEALMNAGNKLEELTIADGHNREEKCFISTRFPWGYPLCDDMKRHCYHNRRINPITGNLFPRLRKLELSGHSTMGLLNLAGLFFSLTPGILKELVLESLAMAHGRWEDLFRIIAPKGKWTEENQVWPGAHAHAIVQTFLSSSNMVRLTVGHLAAQLREYRKRAKQAAAQPRPTQFLWKGLQLEKCQLKDLQYLDDDMESRRHSLGGSPEEVFGRWMLDGLDDEQYDVLLPPGHDL
ncbi:hypothetical protein EV426DRAFT_215891 [Tirmania nivea]|nr:hypothetical protein EV426DRAFT_215891 [Tirmania nivea]